MNFHKSCFQFHFECTVVGCRASTYKLRVRAATIRFEIILFVCDAILPSQMKVMFIQFTISKSKPKWQINILFQFIRRFTPLDDWLAISITMHCVLLDREPIFLQKKHTKNANSFFRFPRPIDDKCLAETTDQPLNNRLVAGICVFSKMFRVPNYYIIRFCSDFIYFLVDFCVEAKKQQQHRGGGDCSTKRKRIVAMRRRRRRRRRRWNGANAPERIKCKLAYESRKIDVADTTILDIVWFTSIVRANN